MITKDKVTEIFCIIDELDKNLSAEFAKNLRLPSHNSDGKRRGTAGVCGKIKAVGTFFMLNLSRTQVSNHLALKVKLMLFFCTHLSKLRKSY